MQARVYVTLKRGVLDPQGKAIARSLQSLGFDEVEDARMGKFIEITLKDLPADKARKQLEEMCTQLLANLVIEDYRIELVDA